MFFYEKELLFIYKRSVSVLNKKTHFSIHPGGGWGVGGVFFLEKGMFFYMKKALEKRKALEKT